MFADLLALLDKPVLLVIVLTIGGVIGVAVEGQLNRLDRERRRAFWRGRNPGTAKRRKIVPTRNGTAEAGDLAGEQLKSVMAASFKARPLLNRPERRLLSVIDKTLAELECGWRAMGQVSLGEILSSCEKDAFWAINAKRVDLLIVDEECQPVAAIEFQGTGHHRGRETAARDAVKREALRRAGIALIEVVSGDTPSEVKRKIAKLSLKEAGSNTAFGSNSSRPHDRAA